MAITLSRTPEDDEGSHPVWGEKICSQYDWSFDEVFRHQFRAGPSPVITSANWKSRRLGWLWIEHCPSLPATEIRNRRGHPLGWLLGMAVGASGEPIGAGNGDHLTMNASWEAIERRQAQFSGRFVIFARINGEMRFYPDATSGLTSITHCDARVLASTAPLAVHGEFQPTNGRTFEQIQNKSTLYLMGETADMRTTQTMANHYVNLDNFSTHRFWPTEDTIFDPHDAPEEATERMVTWLQTAVGGFGEHFDTTLPITGGKDSRLLAAAVPEERVKDFAHFYVHEINWATGFDVSAAEATARHLKLPFTIRNVRSGSCDRELASLDVQTTRAQIALATGFAHPNQHPSVLKAMHVAPKSRVLLRGGAAEVAQANKYPMPGDIPATMTAEFAFARNCGHSLPDLRKIYGEDTIERLLVKYSAWFETLPEAARTRAVDLGHMELWLPASMGAVFYAPRQHFYVNPYSNRRLLYHTMRFEPGMRKRGLLVTAMLDRMSPGLSSVPYARMLQAEAQAEVA